MVQDKLEKIKALTEEVIVELPEEIKAEKAASFAEGAASVGSDKIYSQADLDAKVAEAVAAKEEELQKKISDLESLLASEKELSAKYLAAIKAEIEDEKQDTARLEAAIA